MKVKVTVHIFYNQYHWEQKGQYIVLYAKVDETESFTYVNSQEIEIEVPESFDPRTRKIAALENQKKKMMADYQNKVTEINERISNLKAIEFTV